MSENFSKSKQLFQQAKKIMPGGVSSPVRAFRAVGGQPLFIERGEGPHLFDVDGNKYIDYVLSWGPLILGHAHPDVVAALDEAISRGTSYGAPNSLEIELVKIIQDFMPNLEMIRFVNSGTEATMSALRLARAYTGRNKIIKFEGCYHGHADQLLVRAGSGVATLGLPDSPGVPSGSTEDTLVARYNGLENVADIFKRFPDQIAAVIVEPVAGNMGVVPTEDGFLDGLSNLTRKHETLLIFDEVMTGFRVHLGGAQTLYGIEPDITTLGKVIGGGLPVGAYGGRREIMEMIAPSGSVYQAGTLSGNPLAMTAGIATLRLLQSAEKWATMETTAQRLGEGIQDAAQEAGVPIRQTRVGTMFSTFFTDHPILDWPSVETCDTVRFSSFFQGMLSRGVYLAPSQFEAGFISTEHDEAVVDATIQAARESLNSLDL